MENCHRKKLVVAACVSSDKERNDSTKDGGHAGI